MTNEFANTPRPVYVSLAIFAWNEQRAIVSCIKSLFQQTLFSELAGRPAVCEVLCVCNGCTDQTAAVAAGVFEEENRTHPCARAFTTRVLDLSQRGKLNAWNRFVHEFSTRQARYLFMMDADILLNRRETLCQMLLTLETDAQAHVAVDRPQKDLLFKGRKSIRDRLSLASAEMTLSAEAQLCAQLYCIRAEVARNIFMPRDLPACEDGFLKTLVCTDLLQHPVRPERIRVAEHAEHVFEAYTSPLAILKNQKRQIIGQTIVHILVDQFLNTLPFSKRQRMAETIKTRELADPGWLKRLIAQHLQRTRFFWRLYPALPAQSFRRLKQLHGFQRFVCFPAALARFGAEMLSSYGAYRSLKAGCTDYWPKADRAGLGPGVFATVPQRRLASPPGLGKPALGRVEGLKCSPP